MMGDKSKSLRKPPALPELTSTKLRQRYIIGSSGVKKGSARGK